MDKNSNILFPAEEVHADHFCQQFQEAVSEINWVNSTSGIYTEDEKQKLMFLFEGEIEDLEDRFILRPLTNEELGYNATRNDGKVWPGFGLSNNLFW